MRGFSMGTWQGPISWWGPQQAPQLLQKPREGEVIAKVDPLPHLPANHWGSQNLTLILVGSTSCLEATEEGEEQENSAPSLSDGHKINV